MDGVSCGIGVILKYFTVYLHQVSKVNRLHKRPIGCKKGHDPTEFFVALLKNVAKTGSKKEGFIILMNYRGATNQSLRNKLKIFFHARKLIIWQQEGRGNVYKKVH